MTKKKLLYIEDSEINRFVVKELASDKYEIHAVETADECFKLVKSNSYEILLIDLNLNDPNIDGFGVLKELKSYDNLKDSIFVAHTNYFGGEWEEKCKEAGFDYYYPKPFVLETFEQLLSK